MDISTRSGTICGTLMVLLFRIQIGELFTTTVLALVGATVSFLVSLFWKFIFKKWR